MCWFSTLRWSWGGTHAYVWGKFGFRGVLQNQPLAVCFPGSASCVASTRHLPDSCSHLSLCSLSFTSHFPCAWEEMAVQELGWNTTRTMLEQVLHWGCQQLSSLLGLKMKMGSNSFGSTPCCCWLSLYMLKDLKCGLWDEEVGNLEWVQTPNCWSSSWSVHRSATRAAGRAFGGSLLARSKSWSMMLLHTCTAK